MKSFPTEALRGAVDENRLYFGIDSTALVQCEAFTPRDGVSRGLKFLAAKYCTRSKFIAAASFNLCPRIFASQRRRADTHCLSANAPRTAMTVEGYEPHTSDRRRNNYGPGGVEVGGIEYVTDDRTGRQLYYDVNALSNFVVDPCA
jgi:hypothetical protein